MGGGTREPQGELAVAGRWVGAGQLHRSTEGRAQGCRPSCSDRDLSAPLCKLLLDSTAQLSQRTRPRWLDGD